MSAIPWYVFRTLRQRRSVDEQADRACQSGGRRGDTPSGDAGVMKGDAEPDPVFSRRINLDPAASLGYLIDTHFNRAGTNR